MNRLRRSGAVISGDPLSAKPVFIARVKVRMYPAFFNSRCVRGELVAGSGFERWPQGYELDERPAKPENTAAIPSSGSVSRM